MVIESIRGSPLLPHRLLVLRERIGPRYLVLGIGPLEAEAIALHLQGVRPPRPLSHDTLIKVIERLGGHVQRIEITELSADTFHARLVLERNGQEVSLDARPSDGVALAVRAQAPIYAVEAVLDQAGVVPEEESSDAESEAEEPLDESKLDVFKKFIDTLDAGPEPPAPSG